MIQLEKLKQYLDELDDRSLYRYFMGFLAGVAAIMGLVVLLQYRAINTITKKIKALNSQRIEAQEILTRFEQVTQQKEAVESVLEKDKSFRIVGYVDTLLNNLQLNRNKGPYQPTTEPLEGHDTYDEVTLIVPLIEITMRNLAELLNEIEKNERIYIKQLDIVKSQAKPAIDVTVTLATLQPRTPGVTQ
jgi:hypothetical protein